VKAPDDLHVLLELATLVNLCKRPQRRMSRDATRIGAENDDFDVVSHAPENRGGRREAEGRPFAPSRFR
jgi:hypothetical protein